MYRTPHIRKVCKKSSCAKTKRISIRFIAQKRKREKSSSNLSFCIIIIIAYILRILFSAHFLALHTFGHLFFVIKYIILHTLRQAINSIPDPGSHVFYMDFFLQLNISNDMQIFKEPLHFVFEVNKIKSKVVEKRNQEENNICLNKTWKIYHLQFYLLIQQ